MARYEITRRSSGLTLGIYEGADETDALRAMAKDAGEPGANLRADDWIVADATLPEPDAIRALRRDAASAGDDAQVRLCDQALAGDVVALEECAAVMADARAQA